MNLIMHPTSEPPAHNPYDKLWHGAGRTGPAACFGVHSGRRSRPLLGDARRGHIDTWHRDWHSDCGYCNGRPGSADPPASADRRYLVRQTVAEDSASDQCYF